MTAYNAAAYQITQDYAKSHTPAEARPSTASSPTIRLTPAFHKDWTARLIGPQCQNAYKGAQADLAANQQRPLQPGDANLQRRQKAAGSRRQKPCRPLQRSHRRRHAPLPRARRRTPPHAWAKASSVASWAWSAARHQHPHRPHSLRSRPQRPLSQPRHPRQHLLRRRHRRHPGLRQARRRRPRLHHPQIPIVPRHRHPERAPPHPALHASRRRPHRPRPRRRQRPHHHRLPHRHHQAYLNGHGRLPHQCNGPCTTTTQVPDYAPKIERCTIASLSPPPPNPPASASNGEPAA